MDPQVCGFNTALRLFFVAVVLSFVAVPTQTRRKDVVIMKNGDHFTGDVKSLQDGVLSVETDYVSGNIGLDWNQVESVESTATYQIVLNDGQRLVGKIERVSGKKAKGAGFYVRQGGQEIGVAAASVVNIGSEKPTILRQLQGTIDVEYSFTSGNSQSTLDLSTNAKYRATGWEAAASFDSSVNGQSGASKTNRQDVQATFAKFLNRNSYLMGLSDFLHSSQQDLNLRTTLGGGYGRYLIRSTNSYLGWLGGAVYTRESFDTTADQQSDQNVESVLGIQYHLSRFNFGQLNSQILVFPGLSDAGRVRITTNNSLTIKLINNFHLSFSVWDNFDSRPPVTARRNELGVSSGIGWSF
jgi:putative salt-induced outer membrane protein YdiY